MKLGYGPFRDFEVLHFEYFRVVCIPEFSLYFQEVMWETIVLQAISSEPCMRHAALAISALTRSRYHPSEAGDAPYQIESAIEYSMKQYNLAIQKLNKRLDISTQSWELAILGSIIFTAFEALQGHDNRVQMHLRSAFAILEAHPNAATCSMSCTDSGVTPLVAGENCWTAWGYTHRSSRDLDYLVKALIFIDEQASSFTAFHESTLF